MTWGSLGIDDANALARLQPEVERRDLLGDDVGAAKQNGRRDLFVDNDLGGAQDPLVLALGEDDRAFRTLGAGEHRLHRLPRMIDQGVDSSGMILPTRVSQSLTHSAPALTCFRNSLER